MTDSDLRPIPPTDPAQPAPQTSSGSGMPAGLALAWRAPVIGYGITLAASLVLAVLALVALASDDAPSEVADVSSATEGILAWLAMPFQLAAMALGGRIGVGTDGFSVSLFALPLLLTATYVVTVAKIAGSSENRMPSRARSDRAAISGAAAVGAAVVVALLTRLLALRSDGTVIHALSVSLVIGTLFFTFVADLVGRELRAAGLPAIVRAWLPPVVAWLVHVGVWMVVSLPVLFVVAWAQEGFRAALSIPLWWPIAGIWTYALGHLSGVGTSGFYSYAWSIDGVLTPVALLAGAVVAAVVASIAWHVVAGRTPSDLARPASWAQLPAVFAVGGIVLTLLSTVSVGGGAFGVSGALAIMPAAWTCLLLALWGLATEAMSRSIAPRLAGALPAAVVTRLRAGAQARDSSPQDASDVVAAEPMSPEQARKVRRILILVGGGLALVVAGAVAVSVIGSTYFTPERAAQTYVDAVADGDVDAVAAMLPDDADYSPTLLTEEVYDAATDRPTSYTIGDVTTLGSSAMVDVTAEGGVGGESYLSLEKGDKKFGIFQEWDVTEGLTSSLSVMTDDVDEIAVNGVTVEAPSEGYGTFAVLPGTYTVDPYAGNEWIAGTASEVAVPLGEFASPDMTSPEPSQAFMDEVDEAVQSLLDDCMSSTELEPDGCPQSGYAYGDVRDVTWELTEAPQVEYDYFDPSFPMELYVSGGVATASYEVDESYGFGAADWTPETEESSLDFSVEIDVAGDSLEVTPTVY